MSSRSLNSLSLSPMKSVSNLSAVLAVAFLLQVSGVPLKTAGGKREEEWDAGRRMAGRRLLQSGCSLLRKAPLSGVAEAAFTMAEIGQETPFTKASNTISVTLQLNVDMEVGSEITISGLIGTLTMDSTEAMLTTSANLTASWIMSTGSLTLTVGARCLAADSPHSINFTVQNSMTAQAPVAVNISATVTDGSTTQAIGPMPMAVPMSRTVLKGVQGGGRPLMLVSPIFLNASMIQSNPFTSEANTLTATLRTNVDVAAHSKITLHGLTGFEPTELDAANSWPVCIGPPNQDPAGPPPAGTGTGTGMGTPPPGPAPPMGTPGPNVNLNGNSTRNSTMQMRGTPAGAGTPPPGTASRPPPSVDAPVQVQVSLCRPTDFVAIKVEAVSASSGAGAGAGAGAGQNPTTSGAVSSSSTASLSRTTTGGPLAATNFTETTASWSMTTGANETTPAAAMATTAAAVATTAAAVAPTPRTTPAPVMPFPWPSVASEPLPVLAAFAGKDRDGAGVVVMYLSTDVRASVYYAAAVKGMSPAMAQSAIAVSVRGEIEAGEFDAVLEEKAVAVPNYPLLGITNGMNPLDLVPRPAFTQLLVNEAHSLRGAANTISVWFAANFALQANAKITLSGLTGSSEPDNAAIALTSAQSVMAAGQWAQTAGNLTLTVSAPIPASTLVMLAVVLRNPVANQLAVAPTLACPDCFLPLVPVASRQTTTSNAGVLGIRGAAAACAMPANTSTLPLFGAACDMQCSGVVDGPFCDCLPGQFGQRCAQTAALDAANSASPTLVSAASAASVAVLAASGVGVSIPPGALLADAVVSVSSYQAGTVANDDDSFRVLPELAAEQDNLSVIGLVTDMQPEMRFAAKVNLTLAVDMTKHAAALALGKTFQIHFLNKTTRMWESMGESSVDATTGLMMTQTDHFSLWTVMSVPSTSLSATPPPEDDDGGGLSDRNKLIIIIACSAFGALLLCCCLLLCMRRRKRGKGDKAEATEPALEAAEDSEPGSDDSGSRKDGATLIGSKAVDDENGAIEPDASASKPEPAEDAGEEEKAAHVAGVEPEGIADADAAMPAVSPVPGAVLPPPALAPAGDGGDRADGVWIEVDRAPLAPSQPEAGAGVPGRDAEQGRMARAAAPQAAPRQLAAPPPADAGPRIQGATHGELGFLDYVTKFFTDPAGLFSPGGAEDLGNDDYDPSESGAGPDGVGVVRRHGAPPRARGVSLTDDATGEGWLDAGADDGGMARQAPAQVAEITVKRRGGEEGSQQGVGLKFEKLLGAEESEQYFRLTAIADDSDAKHQGLQLEDLLMEVDGVDVSDLNAAEVTTFLVGPPGTLVQLKYMRLAADAHRPTHKHRDVGLGQGQGPEPLSRLADPAAVPRVVRQDPRAGASLSRDENQAGAVPAGASSSGQRDAWAAPLSLSLPLAGHSNTAGTQQEAPAQSRSPEQWPGTNAAEPGLAAVYDPRAAPVVTVHRFRA